MEDRDTRQEGIPSLWCLDLTCLAVLTWPCFDKDISPLYFYTNSLNSPYGSKNIYQVSLNPRNFWLTSVYISACLVQLSKWMSSWTSFYILRTNFNSYISWMAICWFVILNYFKIARTRVFSALESPEPGRRRTRRKWSSTWPMSRPPSPRLTATFQPR